MQTHTNIFLPFSTTLSCMIYILIQTLTHTNFLSSLLHSFLWCINTSTHPSQHTHTLLQKERGRKFYLKKQIIDMLNLLSFFSSYCSSFWTLHLHLQKSASIFQVYIASIRNSPCWAGFVGSGQTGLCFLRM